MSKRIQPPTCMTCGAAAELRTGGELYPRRRDLWTKWFWVCPTKGCDSYCGCHPGTKRPLGSPAGPELRRARGILRTDKIDPLWMSAHEHECYDGHNAQDRKAIKMIQNAARTRVYRWLADQLKIDPKVCHIGMFDLETCRAAWWALKGVDYPTIRLWAKMREHRDGARLDNVVPFPKRKRA